MRHFNQMSLEKAFLMLRLSLREREGREGEREEVKQIRTERKIEISLATQSEKVRVKKSGQRKLVFREKVNNSKKWYTIK